MKKYYGIDWLRAVACIGIMLMHVAANNAYEIGGFLYGRIIPSFTDFVFLFMAVSAFGMCCGYFDKVMSGKVNWTDFYKKRYAKILPFFLLLILIDLALNFSPDALYEGVMESTLLHGFIPNDFAVIGVAWFLGTVFVFYLIFPFFCVLLENKRRAWCAFVIAIVLHYICSSYFDLDRRNIVCSLCYFLTGGMVYLYKDKLEKVKWVVSLPVVVLAVSAYFLVGANTITRLFVAAALLICAISSNCREIGVITFISGISMEIYLSHMVVFRGIERLHLNTLLGKGWGQYLFTAVLVFLGTVVFSFCAQQFIKKSSVVIKRIKR